MYQDLILGERVKLAMTQRNVSSTKLAKLMGVTPSTIGSIINPLRKTKSSGHTAEIAKHLDVPVEWLLNGIGDPFNISPVVRSNSAIYNLNSSSRYIPISGTINMVNVQTQKFIIEEIEATQKVEIIDSDSNFKAVRINTSDLQPALKLGWIIVYDDSIEASQGDEVIILFNDHQQAFAEYLYKRNEWYEFDSLNNKGRASIHSSEVNKICPIAYHVMPSKVKAINPTE